MDTHVNIFFVLEMSKNNMKKSTYDAKGTLRKYHFYRKIVVRGIVNSVNLYLTSQEQNSRTLPSNVEFSIGKVDHFLQVSIPNS